MSEPVGNQTRQVGTGSGAVTRLVEQNPRVALLLIIILIGVLGLVFIFVPLRGEVQLLDKLSEVAYARGVITFVFAVGTILIAVIVALAGLLGGDDAGERFNRSKEVFTVLVGILGTILGFYFGNESSQPPVSGGQELAIESWSVEAVTGDGGAVSVELEATVNGGTSPYAYSIRFDPAVIGLVEGTSEDGAIKAQIPVAAGDQGEEVRVTLEVTDDDDNRTAEEKELRLGAPPS